MANVGENRSHGASHGEATKRGIARSKRGRRKSITERMISPHLKKMLTEYPKQISERELLLKECLLVLGGYSELSAMGSAPSPRSLRKMLFARHLEVSKKAKDLGIDVLV